MSKTVNSLQAFRIMTATKGKIFSVTFTKRTNNQKRKMVCRLGVSKNLTGNGLKFSPIEKNLLTVFDMQAKGYRSINLDAVNEVVSSKETFLIQ